MRIWNLRLNLDEFNALGMSAFTDQDRSDILRGLILGCNAGTQPEQCSQFVEKAFTVGLSWRKEAENFSYLKSMAGKASAESRQNRLGSSNPRANREQTVNSVHSLLEQDVNQSTIHNNIIKDKTETTANAASPGKAKPRKAEWREKFDDDILEATGEIMSFWPDASRRQPNSDSSVPRSSGPQLASRLTKIKKAGGDLSICIAIAKRAVEEFERGKWAKAVENFFGKSEDAPWLSYYQAHTTNLEAINGSRD